jgi:SpoVK/Ycf46/Vps4 family AAA+-type ATPase
VMGDDKGSEDGDAATGKGKHENEDCDANRSVTMAHFEWAMPTVGASVARSVAAKFAPASWEDIGGLENVKRLLTQYCVWPITRAGDFKRLGIDFPKGVLLHGPPGCAKTTLARAAVTASGATFIPLLGTSLYSM